MHGPSHATSSRGSHDAALHTASYATLDDARAQAAPTGVRRTDRARRGAASSTGRQSDTSTVQATPGSLVHDASAASTGASALSASRTHHALAVHLPQEHRRGADGFGETLAIGLHRVGRVAADAGPGSCCPTAAR